MALVRFQDDEYEFCDVSGIVRFRENKTHRLLFDYISKDLSKLPNLLEQYI